MLEVEDELREVFDRIYVVVGRGRYERDAGNGVAGAGDDVVHLIARQLSALAGLRALRHLNLYLLGIDEIFRRHAEAAGGDLLRLAAQRDAVEGFVEAVAVLAALARVAARAELVHRQCQGLVRLLADCAERHCARHKAAHQVVLALHLFNGHGHGCLAELEEVAQEYRRRLLVGEAGKILKLLVAAEARSELQGGNGLRVPRVGDAVLAVGELPYVGQEFAKRGGLD